MRADGDTSTTPVRQGAAPVSAEQDLPAGPFASWVDQTVRALTSDDGIEVPCGGCTACCRSAYFIHIDPPETRTLERIPPELLFPAPGRPDGHVVLGYDERGHCPMLVDDRCSIYDDRPISCRTYDCRVFAATGLSPDDDGKPLVAERVRRWTFDVTTTSDRRRYAAVRGAAAYLRARPESFPHGALPRNTGDLATAAVKVHEAFIDSDGETNDVDHPSPDIEVVRAQLRA
jgi:Fe-S-cluster containining protein